MSANRLATPTRRDGGVDISDEEFEHDRAGVLARLKAEGDMDFGPAVLDPAHIGDIQGSFGTISLRDRAPRRTWTKRVLTFLAIMGPGVIVMMGDNDAGGVQTYTNAGQAYGNSMLWVLVGLFVVLFTAQEMVTRLGAVTGVGHARLIRERFGLFWNIFSVGDLFILNFLTLLTEFIGVSFALQYFGISKDYSVPVSAVALFTFAATGNFRRWERFMMIFVFGAAIVIPLFFIAHPQAGPMVHGSVVPGIEGGITGTAILLIVAIVGTTVAPWQLFFQQSNILDKRISPRWLKYERVDTFGGAIFTTVFAGMMIAIGAFALNGTKKYGFGVNYTDSGWFDNAIRSTLGYSAGALAAIMLLVAAVLGAGAVSLATSYAFGDSFGQKHSLHRTVRTAPVFYTAYAGQIVVAATMVLLASGGLLGTLTEWVQVLAGVLLPSAIVFLVLLCNDKVILGPWVNKTWQNVVDFTIIGILIVLSMILVISALFSSVNGVLLTEVLFAAGAGLTLVVGGPILVRARMQRIRAGGSGDRLADVRGLDRKTWRMPPLEQLERPAMSGLRKTGLILLRGYLIVAVLLITIKVFSNFIH